jgi:putative ABC transport system permease protein
MQVQARDGGIASIGLAVRVGLDALTSHPLRTSIAMLGVAVGVAALVVVLALGDGMERAARSEIERTTDFQTVAVSSVTTRLVDGMVTPVQGYPILSSADAAAASSAISSAAQIALVTNGTALIQSTETGARIYSLASATTSGADRFMRLDFSEGRYFTGPEDALGRRVVVLSHLTAARLANGHPAEGLVGHLVRLGGEPFEVVGVLASYPGEREFRAYLPTTLAARVFASQTPRPVPTLLLRAPSLEQVAAVRAETVEWIADRFGRRGDMLSVRTATDRLAQTQRAVLLFKIFVGAIAGIAVLVGCVGITNVLLAAIVERTREIGMRKAAGARRRDILWQFIAESVAITGLGSVTGMLVGVVLALGIGALLRTMATSVFIDVSISPSTIVVAAVAPVLCGLVFGTYPARRASRLSPIDAMRQE